MLRWRHDALGDRSRRGEGFRLYLIDNDMAEATVCKHCGFAKHFFADAIDRRVIAENPFAKIPSSPIGNPKRSYHVSRDEAAKVLEACPDADWRCIFSLVRFGGLRCPSEVMRLRWEDVLWDRDRMIVHSPKTERHESRENRVVPLFPELREVLEERFELAEKGDIRVVTRYTENHCGNLRTQMTRIIKRAGIKPWPRIFHNLRATRQTELEEQFPSHVVCAWIGNTETVARKHYLQVTDRHFDAAAEPGALHMRCSKVRARGFRG